MAARLRPLGIGEILDAGVVLYRRHFLMLLGLTAIVVLPVQVAVLLVTLSTAPEDAGETVGLIGDFDANQGSMSDDDVWVALAGGFVATALGFVGSALATATVTRPVANAYLGDPVDGRDALRGLRDRWRAVLVVGLVTGALTAAGIFLFLVPGIWLLTVWSVAMPAIVLEGATAKQAFGRSMRLVRGRAWAMLGMILAGQLLATALQLGLSLPLELVVGDPDNVAASTVLQGVVTLVTSTLVAPFLAAAIVVAYVDLRVRHEGFDVQLLAARLPRAASPALP